MLGVPLTEITKQGADTESFYDYIVSRFIAPFFTAMFRFMGLKNPNVITLFSFFFVFVSSYLMVSMKGQELWYRVLAGLLIQVSFILDCSDGQLARIINRTSRLGAWLDRILDRVGEFILYSVAGYTAYVSTGNYLFIFLGILTGYMFSAFTLAMSLSDSIILEKYKMIRIIKKKDPGVLGLKKDNMNNNSTQGENIKRVLSKIFFFLNIGIGERYLYLTFFIIIDKITIMLYITAFLSFLRTAGIFFHTRNRLRQIDKILKEIKSEA